MMRTLRLILIQIYFCQRNKVRKLIDQHTPVTHLSAHSLARDTRPHGEVGQISDKRKLADNVDMFVTCFDFEDANINKQLNSTLETYTHRHTQTNRHTDTQTHRHTDTHTHTHTHTHTNTHKHARTHTHTNK